MIDYEVHFFRADGTLSLRLLAAAASHDEVMLAVAKMRSREFASVKVWRGIPRARVRHQPAMAVSAAISVAEPQADTGPAMRPGAATL